MTKNKKYKYIFKKTDKGSKLIKKWLEEDPEYDINTWEKISKNL